MRGRAGAWPVHAARDQQVLLTLIAGMASLVSSILMIHPLFEELPITSVLPRTSS